jgi:hypothetical protein
MLSSGMWRRVDPKRRFNSQDLHGATSQKTALLNLHTTLGHKSKPKMRHSPLHKPHILFRTFSSNIVYKLAVQSYGSIPLTVRVCLKHSSGASSPESYEPFIFKMRREAKSGYQSR